MGKNKVLVMGLLVALVASMVLIGGCVPTGTPEEGGTETWMVIVFLLLIFVVFYFLMIRPQRKRQKAHEELVQQLTKGDQVVTAGGIFGVIESISDDSVVIKVESGTTMRVAKGSVALKRER